MKDIPTRYNPKETEDKWYSYWTEKELFHADPNNEGKPYTIVIPPPNITGVLHMGHALNNTIQDILIRWKKMQGFNSLWMPGTDHAGIATQNVVERMLKKKGTSRQEVGREKFLEYVWNWRDEYGSTIINQLKRLGYSCDWQRTRFTMDPGLSQAVQDVFIRLFEKGLIYRGDYIINWCPRCQTALSDEESEHKDLKGYLYYIKYPLKKPTAEHQHITVATTRPETMLGDTAVAVNPQDERYKFLHGKTVILPLLDRELKVVVDDYVDPEFGTGIVKITPAHDPNDFLVAQRHNLPVLNVLNKDATLNDNAGPYSGQDRFECREALLVDLRDRKLLEKTKAHDYAIGHCYRCHTIVEPRVSRQWFVKMKPLAEPAIKAVEQGKIKFYPKRWEKVYLEWMYNIRDWCISRQIWWGHRIPVWYCPQCQTDKTENRNLKPGSCNEGFVVAKTKPLKCPKCGNKDLVQDQDVLDTWFSSWLWPFSTLGWPNETKELKFYYPTNVLVTAQEIIFFWVARMIMAGLEFIGEVPFSEVYIHGTVRDETGTKMSKSLGNVIDPLEIIEEYGADALRFSIISITAQGQDVFLSRHRFETGRNFCNKIWNASRFLLTNLEANADLGELPAKNKWVPDDWFIIGKLQKITKDISINLKDYRFKEAIGNIYDFFWHDLCDKYIEVAKPVLYGEDEELKKAKQQIIFYVLERTLRILHPFMPFISEDIWQRLQQLKVKPDADSIMETAWPEFEKEYLDEKLVIQTAEKFELVRAGRSLRSEYNISPAKKINFFIQPRTKEEEKYLLADNVSISKLLVSEAVVIDNKFKPVEPMPAEVTACGTIYMSLQGVDKSKEKQRLEKELIKVEKELVFIDNKLNNKKFISRAPKEVVEKERDKKKEIEEKLKKIRINFNIFK